MQQYKNSQSSQFLGAGAEARQDSGAGCHGLGGVNGSHNDLVMRTGLAFSAGFLMVFLVLSMVF